MRSPRSLLAAGAFCPALAACGSRLDPDSVAQVNGTAAGVVGVGGRLARSSLLDAGSKVKNRTGNGLRAPQQVGSKAAANCQSILQPDGGEWRKVSPGDSMCAPLIDSATGS
jgi:hypothetical protein